MSPQERIQEALQGIQEGLALLRAASAGLPVNQRHLFLQAVGRLEATYGQVAGLVESINAS